MPDIDKILDEVEELGLEGVLDKYAPLDKEYGRAMRALYAQNPLLEKLMQRARKCQS